MCKIRRRDTVKCPGFNWFTTGPIPVDAKGATMAKLDKLANENRIENRNRNHNNILLAVDLAFNALPYITSEHCAHCYRRFTQTESGCF